jgi:peptidoglycan/xylan/chitin deacetylase (PgdA/CDA1 family)
MAGMWPRETQCAVSICFDDGLASQLEWAVPLLDRYAVPATFYLTTHMREHLSPEARRTLIDPWAAVRRAGHEIGNHTRSHPCSANFSWTKELHATPLEALSVSDMAKEIDDAQVLLAAEMGQAPLTFAYPCGMTFVGRGRECRSFVPLVAERFVVGRGYGDECAAAPLRCDLARVPASRMDNRSVAELLELVEAARVTGDWLLLVAHTVAREPQPYSTDTTTLEAFLQELVARRADVWLDTVERVGLHVQALQAALPALGQNDRA